MKKRTKIIFLCAIVFVTTVLGVFAAINNSEYFTDEYDAEKEIDMTQIDDIDKLKLVAEKIKNDVPDADDAYMQTLNYVYAIEKYSADSDEQNYLHDLVLNGADADMIRKIYVFLQDTDYPIEMVETIYNIGKDICEDDDYWIETAFNQATDNIHGVLDKEQVTEYLEKGITADEINTANVLSRKGVYTINEILDKRLEGARWDNIFDNVYNNITSSGKLLQVSGFKKVFRKIGEQNLMDMIDAVQLAEISGQNPAVFFLDDTETVEDYKVDIVSEVIDKSEDILESIDVTRPIRTVEKADDNILEEIRENGIPDEQIVQYFNDGLSEFDIRNAIYIANDQNTEIDTIIQKQIDGMTLNDIIGEGGENQ